MTFDSKKFIPLDFSHVYYDEDDFPISFLMACFTLIPQVILIIYPTIILSRREMEACMMFTGQLLNEGLNEYLKRHLKQDRPFQLRKFKFLLDNNNNNKKKMKI